MSLTLVQVDSYDILNNPQAQKDKYGDDPAGTSGDVLYIPGVGGIGTAIQTQFDGGRDRQLFGEWGIHPYQIATPDPTGCWIMHFDVATFYSSPSGPGALRIIALYGAPNPTTADSEFIFLIDSSNQYAFRYIDSGGASHDVALTASATYQTSTTNPTYDNIQIRVVPGSSANVTIVINGITQVTNFGFNGLFYSPSSPHAPGIWTPCNVVSDPTNAYDNFLVWTGTSPTEAFPGPQHVYGLEMDSLSGTGSGWTFTGTAGATDLLSSVSDLTAAHTFCHDQSGTYDLPSGVGTPLDFFCQTITVDPTLGVAINIHTQGSSSILKGRFAGIDLDPSPALTTSFWPGLQWILPENPLTSAPWTISDVNSNTWGFKNTSGIAAVTEIYLEFVQPAGSVIQTQNLTGQYSIAGNTVTTRTLTGQYAIVVFVPPPPVPTAPAITCNPFGPLTVITPGS